MAKSYPVPEMARIWGEPLPNFLKTTNNIEKFEEKRREEVIKHTLQLTTNIQPFKANSHTEKQVQTTAHEGPGKTRDGIVLGIGDYRIT